MCLSTFLVVCPAFVVLLDKGLVLEMSSDAVGLSNEVWLRCMRIFLNVNKGIHVHRVASVSVCRSASVSFFFLPTHTAPKYSPTRTLRQIHLILYPIIPIHASFQLFNHGRGLWDTALMEKKRNRKQNK